MASNHFYVDLVYNVSTSLPPQPVTDTIVIPQILNTVTNAILFIMVVFGTCSAATSVTVFLQMGLNDSVAISLFTLTVSDLTQGIFQIVYFTLFYISVYLRYTLNTSFIGIVSVMIYWKRIFLDMSTLTTTYVAIQRCLCVALPLRFKSDFTTGRTVGILLSLFMFSVVCYIPMLATHYVTRFKDSRTNQTIFALTFGKARDQASTTNDVLNKVTIPISCQIVCIICLGILIVGLKSSSKFRSSASTDTEKPAGAQQTKKGVKGVQAVKCVILVTAVFVICNTPAASRAIARRLVNDFDIAGRYRGLFSYIGYIQNIFENSSIAMNIFIYLRYNSKFRSTFLAMYKNDQESATKK